MTVSHTSRLDAASPQMVYPLGTRTDMNQQNFPILKEMALSLLRLKPKGFREPHWHPNASELSYCLEGRGLMTIFSPGEGHDTFIIEPGTLAFVPMGYLHHVQNIGSEPLKMLLCFNDANPEDLNLSSSMGITPSSILGSTFSLKSSFFEELHPPIKPVFIGEYSQDVPLSLSWQTNRFKLDMESEQPQIKTRGGSVRLSNSNLLSSLDGLAMYKLMLEPYGVREPHWHPNAHEFNYVIDGQVRISILSPDGVVDTFDMQTGDVSFLPKGYYHYIENTGGERTHLAIFFNHESPSDIGLSGGLGAYPNDLLGDLFGVPVSHFGKLPKYQEDLFVVAGGG